MLSLKNRVGNFLILGGLIGLLIFVATAITPPEHVDLWAFLIGAALVGVGVRFRLDKRGRPTAPPPRPAGPPPGAQPRPAPKGKGPAKGGGKPAGPPPGPPPRPARRGPLATIFKGPAQQKTAPKGPPGAGAGGKPPAKGRK